MVRKVRRTPAKKTTRRDKGQGALYQRASDGYWVGTVTLSPDPVTGRRRRKTVYAPTERQAKIKLAKLRRELEQNGGDLPTTTPTLKQWSVTFLERVHAQQKPNTWKNYKAIIENYILPALGRYKLDKITPAQIDALIVSCTKPKSSGGHGLSSTTTAIVYRVLSTMLQVAYKQAVIFRNPCMQVTPPKKNATSRDSYTVEQALAMLEIASRTDYFPRMVLALLTGVRPTEALGLRWQDIDFNEGLIHVNWALNELPWEHGCQDKDGKPTCGHERMKRFCPKRRMNVPDSIRSEHVSGVFWLLEPKTARSNRGIPMPRMLYDALKRQHEKAESEWVFPGKDGLPMRKNADWRTWKKIAAEAGCGHMAPYCSRHTAATLLQAIGADQATVMAILGHTSARTTANYTHVQLETTRRVLDELGGLLDAGEHTT